MMSTDGLIFIVGKFAAEFLYEDFLGGIVVIGCLGFKISYIFIFFVVEF